MGTRNLHVTLWDLVGPLARTFDLMSPALAEHSLRVAYLALRLAEEMELDADARREVCLAGALHDIGAFSLDERLDLLAFEETRPMQHAEAGYLLLREFAPFREVAGMVRCHHLAWNHGAGETHEGRPVPRGSHLLHLADRVAVLVTPDARVLGQVPQIRATISGRSGNVFVPEMVDAFLKLAQRDYVWLEIASGGVAAVLNRSLAGALAEIDLDALLAFSRLICRIIDFKSAFTATHSSGVAATGAMLARLVGFSPRECRMFQIAGYLHDLGKLAIPAEILEKPGHLSPEEWQVMRTHVFFTYQILDPIEALSRISAWGALHQERLNGSGYPFHYMADDIPLGSRIMAVADVFTAITEDRPYRRGMGQAEALAVLHRMARQNELDGALVDLLVRHFAALNRVRAEAQAAAAREYDDFRTALGLDQAPAGP